MTVAVIAEWATFPWHKMAVGFSTQNISTKDFPFHMRQLIGTSIYNWLDHFVPIVLSFLIGKDMLTREDNFVHHWIFIG